MKLAMVIVAFICSFVAAAQADVQIFKGKIEGKPSMACFLKVEKNGENFNFEPFASRFRLVNHDITQKGFDQNLLRNDMQLYLSNGVQALNLSFDTRVEPYEYSVLSAEDEVLFICSELSKV